MTYTILVFLCWTSMSILTRKKVTYITTCDAARFSPDDKYARQRYLLKKRFGLLPTQQPAQKYWSTGWVPLRDLFTSLKAVWSVDSLCEERIITATYLARYRLITVPLNVMLCYRWIVLFCTMCSLCGQIIWDLPRPEVWTATFALLATEMRIRLL